MKNTFDQDVQEILKKSKITYDYEIERDFISTTKKAKVTIDGCVYIHDETIENLLLTRQDSFITKPNIIQWAAEQHAKSWEFKTRFSRW